MQTQESTFAEFEDMMSHTIHLVERHTGSHITPDYPLAKFWNQAEEIKWYNEKKQQDEEAAVNKGRFNGRR